VPQSNLLGLTIQQAHHDSFTGPARARDSGLLTFVHASGEAADKDSSTSNSPATFSKGSALHREPDAMVHGPWTMRFFYYAQRTMNLV